MNLNSKGYIFIDANRFNADIMSAIQMIEDIQNTRTERLLDKMETRAKRRNCILRVISLGLYNPKPFNRDKARSGSVWSLTLPDLSYADLKNELLELSAACDVSRLYIMLEIDFWNRITELTDTVKYLWSKECGII